MSAAAKRALRRSVASRTRDALARAGPLLAEQIAGHLLAEPAVAEAGQVALYAALPDEVATRPLFDGLSAAGIQRLLPRLGDDGRLAFAAVERWEALVPGPFGVLAPPPEAPAREPAAGDVVVAPGRAFDLAGRRLGRGGGYYDRTFPPGGPCRALLIGMACAAQLVEEVPADSHDRAMDAIVTERGLRWVGERSG